MLLELPPDREVDPSACDNSALFYACDTPKFVRLLLERGVTAHSAHDALYYARENGHTDIVELERGATANATQQITET